MIMEQPKSDVHVQSVLLTVTVTPNTRLVSVHVRLYLTFEVKRYSECL